MDGGGRRGRGEGGDEGLQCEGEESVARIHEQYPAKLSRDFVTPGSSKSSASSSGRLVRRHPIIHPQPHKMLQNAFQMLQNFTAALVNCEWQKCWR